MTDDKAIEAALDAWWADTQNDNATGVTAMRAALAAADKVRAAERFDFEDETDRLLTSPSGDAEAALRRAFAAGLAKGGADRAALVEALRTIRAGDQSWPDVLATIDSTLALVRKGV